MRESAKEKIEQIDYALVESPRPPMYQMHRYIARKPPNVVAEYISHYTTEGDVVLDPFVGSGVTAIEAARLGRKAVAIDLDPMALFIARMTAIPVDLLELRNGFAMVEKATSQRIMEFYRTRCLKCGESADVICRIWESDAEYPREIRYECKKDGRLTKLPDEEDLASERRVISTEIPYSYPTTPLQYPHGIPFLKAEKSRSVDQLFSRRNLICLSILRHSIDQVPDKVVRDLLLFTLTSIVHLATKMMFVRETRPFSSSWSRPSYWIPPVHMESNVWQLYERAFDDKQSTLRGKEYSNQAIKVFEEAGDFDDLSKGANILFLNQSAMDIGNIPSDAIDYVFTDPPYGGAIQYLELSTLWASWAGLDRAIRFDDEITVNSNQKKDFDYYHKMLRAAFGEVFRVLKSGRYLTVTFHSTDIKIWNSIVRAVVFSGFELEKIIYQPPLRASDKALAQPYGSAVGDYYIRFRKPRVRKTAKTYDASSLNYERVVVETAKQIIARRGEPTPFTHILNGIIPELERNGILFARETRGIEATLKEHVNREFTLVDVKKDGMNLGQLWWFKNPSDIPYLEYVPLTERVERVVMNVLNRKVVASFDDILQEVFLNFPNALTPDASSVIGILEQYGKRASEGRWRLRPDVERREKEHNEIVEMLCQIGETCGYEVYGDTTERRRSLSFNYPPEVIQRLQEIDALWYNGDVILAEFEVENTTGFTGALMRGSNIKQPTKRFMVIPDERHDALARKMEDSAFRERVEIDGWLFITYDDLKKLFSELRHHRAIDAEGVYALGKLPLRRRVETTRLDDFIGKTANDDFRHANTQ